MKLLLKSKQPQKEVSERKPELSLADRIKATCEDAEAFIESIVKKEKLEHTSISLEWIRQNMHLKYGRCKCKCALALLEKETKNG